MASSNPLQDWLQRRAPLLVLATIAAFAMLFVAMVFEGLAGIGFWAPPVAIGGLFLDVSVATDGSIGFQTGPFLLGLLVHLVVSLGLAVLFGETVPTLVERLGIPTEDDVLVYGLAGLGYGLVTFVVLWWILVPLVGLLPGISTMLHRLDAVLFTTAALLWGFGIGATRRVWALGPLERLTATGSRASGGPPTPTPTDGSSTEPQPSPGLTDVDPSNPSTADQAETESVQAPTRAEEAQPAEIAQQTEEGTQPDLEPAEPGDESTGPKLDPVSPSAGAAFKRLTGHEPSIPAIQKRLGARLERVSKGKARVFADTKSLTDADGLVPGGVVHALAEVAASHAVRSTLDGPASTVFIDRSLTYPEPVEPGAFEARATVLAQGGQEILVDVAVKPRGGQRVARAEFRVIASPSR